MFSRLLLGVAAVATIAPGAPAQTPVQVELREAGQGAAARLLADVLARPHLAVLSRVPTLGLPRDTTYRTSLVIIGSDVTVASRVEGDLVVVGGALFLRPGAHVTGRAVAIGGGLYDSFLARVGGERLAFRDVTYDPVLAGDRLVLDRRAATVARDPAIAWPGVYGLRIPTYSRVDGLALSAGPRLGLAGTGLVAEPLLTYRSHLGALDPSVSLEYALGPRVAVEARAGRGTETNDAWSRPDVLNSAATLVFGDDERNYYRATRYGAGLRVTRDWPAATGIARVGVRGEDARSVGPVRGTVSEPWSIFGRDDTTRMLRPNPQVLPGRIVSVLPSAEVDWSGGEVTANASLGIEVPIESVDDRRFVQTTADARVAFPTVADHRFSAQLHVVLTAGDTAPPQRWAYVGGGSTLPTRDELSAGGDQLFFAEGLYEIPLHKPELPFLGAPVVGVRYAVGSAGVGRLPRFTQNVGVLVRVNLLRVEYVVDPATGTTAFRVGGSAFR